jgi:hypothetical protein
MTSKSIVLSISLLCCVASGQENQSVAREALKEFSKAAGTEAVKQLFEAWAKSNQPHELVERSLQDPISGIWIERREQSLRSGPFVLYYLNFGRAHPVSEARKNPSYIPPMRTVPPSPPLGRDSRPISPAAVPPSPPPPQEEEFRPMSVTTEMRLSSINDVGIPSTLSAERVLEAIRAAGPHAVVRGVSKDDTQILTVLLK